MNCCGEERSGRICSECGKPIKTPLDGLLAYVLGHASLLSQRVVSMELGREDYLKDWPDRHESYAGRVNRLKSQRDKWQSWADELRILIEEASKNKC